MPTELADGIAELVAQLGRFNVLHLTVHLNGLSERRNNQEA